MKSNSRILPVAFIICFLMLTHIAIPSAGIAQGFKAMSGAKVDTSGEDTKSMQSSFLQGGVRHSEALPEVEKQFQPGQTYNLQVMKAVFDNDTKPMQGSVQTSTLKVKRHEWFKLPVNLQGKFFTDHYYTVYSKELSSGREDNGVTKEIATYNELYGKAVDKFGAAWHYFDDVYNVDIDAGAFKYSQFFRSTKLAYADPNKFSRFQQWRAVKVDKKTNKIVETKQLEAITTSYLIGPNKLREDSSMKEFDQKGRPIRLNNAVRVYQQKTFSVEPNKDDSESLKLFFTEKGWTDLIP